MNSIVISLGGLGVNYLGCYGGAWVETPTFDRFASESFVFDECLVESPILAATREAWWTGCYRYFHNPDEPARTDAVRRSFIRAIRAAGIRTILVRDTSAFAEDPHGDSDRFDRIIDIERADQYSTSRVFEAASRWLVRESGRGQFLLFVDCHGAHPPWFLPELSNSEDAEPEEIDAGREVDDDADSDVAIDCENAAGQARQTYAAVVSHLDSELGSFLDFLRGRAEWEQSLVLITSDCGVDLEDEHSATRERSFLNEGRVHVPLLLRLPGAHDPATRSPALVQPIDVMPTVCEALNVAIPPDVHGHTLLPVVRLQIRSVRDYALMADAGRSLAIRTLNWNLVQPLDIAGMESPPDAQLFVRPDDRWNRNDVAKQFPDVVEQLGQALRRHVVVP